MGYSIINKISSKNVPKWGNTHQYIAIHYLGADGQNYELEPDGTGAHYTIYWDGTIYQRCSHDAIVWAVGTGGCYTQKHPYARNANTISIELCCHCDGNKLSADDPKWYFTTETQNAAVWLTQKLMKELNIPVSNVLRHFDIVNKVCPAPYVHNNKYKTSWTWTEFLQKVKNGGSDPVLYRVRKSWDDPASQIGAYEILDNAKKACPVGYHVFDQNGKIVYTPDTSGASGVPASKESFIAAVAEICRKLYPDTRILPSVVIAQCCLETGYGLGSDAKQLVEVNNLVGAKVDLINNTWQKFTVWQGSYISKTTPEYRNGQLVYVTDRFRVYTNYEQCITDYEQFLLHVQNGKGYKYSCIAGMTNPADVIRRIRIGTGTPEKPEGYCTDPAYEDKIMRIIRENNLTQYDAATEKDHYAVRHDYDDLKYQLGLFHDLNNAKNLADQNWGYRVYDTDTGKLVYKPKLSLLQKFASEMVYMDLLVRDDTKAKKYWWYDNEHTGSFSKTFDIARATNNRKTNCVSGVQWALLRAGLPREAIQWYGSKGIVWVGKDAEKNARKYFDIIDAGGKTVKKCLADGTIQPVDIVTYKTLSHTNAYIANGMSFDCGHVNCNGEKFKQWTCPTPYQNYKVAKILRLK